MGVYVKYIINNNYVYLLDITNLSNQFDQMIQQMTTVLYNLQYKEHQPFIANSDEFIRIVEQRDPVLCGFFNVLFQSTNPTSKNSQTQQQLKKLLYSVIN